MAVQVEEKTVTLSHGKTRYFEAGAGDPTILIHEVGFFRGGDGWRYVTPELATRLHVYAPDCVGWGTGDRLDQPYSFGYLVDFVREFQDALGIEKANIVGHSMGGWIATLLAYESPDRVDKLVLVGAGGTSTALGRGLVDWHPPTRDEINQTLASRVKVPGADIDALTDEACAIAQKPGAAESYRKIMDHMGDPETRQRYNTVRRLPHIKAPTLVICGDKDVALDRWKDNYKLLPNVKLEMIENAEHFIPDEKPHELAQSILNFLAR